MEPEKMMRMIVAYLLNLAANSEPQAFKGFLLGAVLGNTVSNLPEDYFERMIKVEPCGEPGCDCHLLADNAVNLLRELRTDHNRYAGMMLKD